MRIFILMTCIGTTFAFAAVSRLHVLVTTPPSSNVISATVHRRLSDIDLMAIENVAEFCLSVDAMVDECDLEEHQALVNQLAEQRDILLEQRDILQEHVQYLNDILARLLGHEVAGRSLGEKEILSDA
jgi:hypothetical protein